MYDSVYDIALNSAAKRRDTSLASLTDAQNRLRLAYGYTASGGVDPSNPFGQAQLLRDSYQKQTKANTGQLASQGQLYSGYLQSKQNRALEGFNRSDNQLRQSFDAQNAQITGQITGLGNDYNDAALAALAAFNERRQALPPAPAPGAPTGTNPGTGAAPNSLAALIARHGGENVRLTNTGLTVRINGQWQPIPGVSP